MDPVGTVPTGVSDPIFVVGSSRSGTTMVGRMLGRHPEVFTFRELHFFEQLWDRKKASPEWSDQEAVRLFARLLSIQRNGYLRQGDPARFRPEAERALARANRPPTGAPEVYAWFLAYECRRAGASVPCEQTPRNVFFLPQIRSLFPGARAVHMVRDPRDVVYSQKRKWRRRILEGHGGIPRREAIRNWMKYHPLIVAQLWKASVAAADEHGDPSWVRPLRFEELLADPEDALRSLCDFLELEFRPGMLEIPQVGSSHAPDRPEFLGVDPDRSQRWRDGGLRPAEIRLCQWVTGSLATRYGYKPKTVSGGHFHLTLLLLALPFKAFLALLANLSRTRSLFAAVRRRLA